jgi:hypothetical protein
MADKIDFYAMKEQKKTETALMLKYEQNHSGGEGRISVILVEIHAPSKTIRNYSGDAWSDPKQLSDLQAGRYLFHDAKNPEQCNGVDLEYRDKFSADLRQCEAMAKTLRQADAKLRKLRDELGNSDTTGEAFRRIGQVFGCKWLITFDRDAPNRGFGYDDNDHAYRWYTLVEGKDHVNWVVREHYAKKAA